MAAKYPMVRSTTVCALISLNLWTDRQITEAQETYAKLHHFFLLETLNPIYFQVGIITEARAAQLDCAEQRLELARIDDAWAALAMQVECQRPPRVRLYLD